MEIISIRRKLLGIRPEKIKGDEMAKKPDIAQLDFGEPGFELPSLFWTVTV